MSTLEDWLGTAEQALDLPLGQVPTAVRDDLLDLTRDVAHGVTRIAGPLTCYLIGLAVGAGLDPAEAARRLSALVPEQESL